MGKDPKEPVLIGVHYELMRHGFGFVSETPTNTKFVRVSLVKRGKSSRGHHFRFEVLHLHTGVMPAYAVSSVSVTKWKWWKNPFGQRQTLELLTRHSKHSNDRDQEFTVDGLGRLVRRSQKLLTLKN